MNGEIRTRELQFVTDNNRLSGVPIVFNSLSEVLCEDGKMFREVIAPEALSQEFIDTQDIQLNVDHQRDKVIARRKCGRGSLDIEYTPEGVKFSTEVPDTQLGHDIFRMVERGDYSAMSFCYMESRDKNDITWNFKTEDNIPIRTVHRIARLFDVAIVYNPAYSQTSVSARSLEELQNEQEEVKEETKEIEEVEKVEEVKVDSAAEQTTEQTAEQPEQTTEINSENTEINKSEEVEEKRDDSSYLEDLAIYKQKIENL